MPTRTIDLAGAGNLSLDSQESGLVLKGSKTWSVTQRRLFEGVSEGVDVVDLDNGALTVSVLPTRGMGIWRAKYKETPVEWKSPVQGPVHPSLVNLQARNGLGWLEGFCELVCRCGLSSNGPPGTDDGAASPVQSDLTLHGRIANLPAHGVQANLDDAGDGTLSVSGIVDECSMFGPRLRLKTTIRTVAGSAAFTIEDEVENLGSGAAEVELLYHVNLGRPFLEQGSSVACAAKAIAPRDARAAEGIDSLSTYAGPTAGYAEQVYYYEPLGDKDGNGLALLKNAHGHLGLSLAFNIKELPCFSLWKCTQADEDGYVTGLEPGTNYPNFKSFERDQKRVVSLPPGGKHRASITLTVHDSAEAVEQVEQRIKTLQGQQGPTVHKTPQTGWSAAAK